ncbi:MAG TPA: hypothetical protein PK257_02300 [Candidatus Woesebacteria bacterium]|nr:hypothetical protein [Candidatus Woesebacteria bacterium]
MIDFLKRYFILIVLVILVIILIFLKIFYGNNDKNPDNYSTKITPTEVPVQTSFETESEDIVPAEDYVSVLPYLGKKMKILGIKRPGVLEIMIGDEADKDEAIKEIELWKTKYPTFKEYTSEFTIRN